MRDTASGRRRPFTVIGATASADTIDRRRGDDLVDGEDLAGGRARRGGPPR